MSTPTGKELFGIGDVTVDGDEVSLPSGLARMRAPERFTMTAAEEGEGGKRKRRQFSGMAASGRPFKRFGVSVAVDMEGLEIGDGPLPLLRDHDSSRIVGQTTSVKASKDGLKVTGEVFDSSVHGAEVAALADEGLSWQMSVYVPPLELQVLSPGETAKVNGHTIEGPGYVFRKAELREVTVTAVGADANTSLALFSARDEQPIRARTTRSQEVETMSDKNDPAAPAATASAPPPATAGAASNPADGAADPMQSERTRVASILESAGKHGAPSAMSARLIRDGTSAETAEAVFVAYRESLDAATKPTGQQAASGADDLRAAHAASISADAAKADKQDSGDDATFSEKGNGSAGATKPSELRAKFDADPDALAEFGADGCGEEEAFARYRAYHKNRGNHRDRTDAGKADAAKA